MINLFFCYFRFFNRREEYIGEQKRKVCFYMKEDFRNVCDFAQKIEFSKEKSFQTTNLVLLLEVNKCMSVSAVIYEPQNDFEQSCFFVPIATESFLKNVGNLRLKHSGYNGQTSFHQVLM